jgi:hypothetical protein
LCNGDALCVSEDPHSDDILPIEDAMWLQDVSFKPHLDSQRCILTTGMLDPTSRHLFHSGHSCGYHSCALRTRMSNFSSHWQSPQPRLRPNPRDRFPRSRSTTIGEDFVIIQATSDRGAKTLRLPLFSTRHVRQVVFSYFSTAFGI